MKKITIFRTSEYEILSGKLYKESAFKLFALAKEVRQEFGKANLLYSSHIPEATHSAKLIQMVMGIERIIEEARLSRYHIGKEAVFKDMFLRSIRHSYAYCDHIILVSHNMNISALTGCYIHRSTSLTLEAERWNDIFNCESAHLFIQMERLEKKGLSLESITDTLSAAEKEMISSLPYIAD